MNQELLDKKLYCDEGCRMKFYADSAAPMEAASRNLRTICQGWLKDARYKNDL